MKSWKILHSHTVFQHAWYTLRQDTVQLPDGSIVDDYFVSVRRNIVLIFAITADQQVLMYGNISMAYRKCYLSFREVL
jgi:ADP-ribose pyrophosphatase